MSVIVGEEEFVPGFALNMACKLFPHLVLTEEATVSVKFLLVELSAVIGAIEIRVKHDFLVNQILPHTS